MERPKGSVASSDHHVIDDQVMDKGVMIKKVEHREGVHNDKLHASNNQNSNMAIGKNNMCLDLDDHYFFTTNGVQHNNDAYINSILSCYRETLVKEAKNSIGYPSNMDTNYEELETLHRFPINNVGDPFVGSNYRVHSKQFEVCVLNWFARLWEIEKNEYWGYVTNGGTECNLHGVLVGRQVLPDGILYASKDSHCSVFKAANICRIHCVKVATLVSGEIDCADFKLNLLNNNHKPAIVNVNIGTTMKGAVDDLDLVIQTLEQCGFTQDQFYIHCDGALFGFMLPFLKHGPKISSKKPVGSVSVSGHKFMGCPMPCGVQITRLKYTKAHYSKNIVEYINSRDVTISGSRNGHAPIYLWYALCKKGFYGFQNDVLECLKKARYLKDRLRCSGISAMLNNLSNTIVFERPPDEEFVRKWQLACEGNIAHVVVMPYIDIQKLDNFLNELIEKRTIWYQTQNCNPFCVATDIGVQNCACGNHHFTFPSTSSLVATSKL